MAGTASPPRHAPYPPVAMAEQGRRAGVVTRTIVMVVDAAIVVSATALGYLWWSAILFIVRPRTFSWPDPPDGTAFVAAYAICVVYLTVAWATTGRSIGKRLLGLRVLGHRGRPMGWGVAFLRANACTFFPVLLFWSALSRRNRSVQDLVFRTSVIYDWRTRGFTESTSSGEHTVGVGVDVEAPVAHEPDDRHTESVAGADGE